MIDNDFHPHRTQLKALGLLLVQAQNHPCAPSILEPDLYDAMRGQGFGGAREPWLAELLEFGLVHSETAYSRPGFEYDESFQSLCLTPAGTYYTVARAQLFAENWKGLTEDLPQEVVDAPWPLQAYYTPDPEVVIPAADRFVRFDDNQEAYSEALTALVELTEIVRKDNEFATREPEIRDQKLAELQAIRSLLERKEGWSSKLLAVGWAALGYLTTKFTDGPIGEAASHAWTALQRILGLN